MKQVITFVLVLLCSISIYSQEKDSIIYIFPDKVEMKLYERIKETPSSKNYNFEFFLENIDKDTFRLVLSEYNVLTPYYWTNNTNRFILINDTKYPLTLDYDSMFGTSKPNEVGEFGERDEGFVLRTLFIYEGYSIKFTKTGRYVSESLGIYRKIEK